MKELCRNGIPHHHRPRSYKYLCGVYSQLEERPIDWASAPADNISIFSTLRDEFRGKDEALCSARDIAKVVYHIRAKYNLGDRESERTLLDTVAFLLGNLLSIDDVYNCLRGLLSMPGHMKRPKEGERIYIPRDKSKTTHIAKAAWKLMHQRLPSAVKESGSSTPREKLVSFLAPLLPPSVIDRSGPSVSDSDPAIVAVLGWINGFFVGILAEDVVYRILDAFLCEGMKAIIYACLGTVKVAKASPSRITKTLAVPPREFIDASFSFWHISQRHIDALMVPDDARATTTAVTHS